MTITSLLQFCLLPFWTLRGRCGWMLALMVIAVSGMESLLLDWKIIIQIIKGKDKKLKSVENVRRDSKQIGHNVKGPEIPIFSLFPWKVTGGDISESIFSLGDFIGRSWQPYALKKLLNNCHLPSGFSLAGTAQRSSVLCSWEHPHIQSPLCPVCPSSMAFVHHCCRIQTPHTLHCFFLFPHELGKCSYSHLRTTGLRHLKTKGCKVKDIYALHTFRCLMWFSKASNCIKHPTPADCDGST